jgi:hypothetical protein
VHKANAAVFLKTNKCKNVEKRGKTCKKSVPGRRPGTSRWAMTLLYGRIRKFQFAKKMRK